MMGVKSTVFLSRDEAEARFTRMIVELAAFGSKLSDEELEDALADLNDRLKGGEGFENYRITRTEVTAITRPLPSEGIGV